MLPALLRPLLVLIAVLGALTVSQVESAREGGDQRQVASTASLRDGHGFDRGPERLWLAVLGEPAQDALACTEKPARGTCASGERVERLPRTRHRLPALDARRCGAFAPGEHPAALSFLRMNGSANAGGTGT